jgi:tRNA uridine 5-carboxymethylaminomethyl modification enzyme
MDTGHRLGLVPITLYDRFQRKRERIEQEVARLRTTRPTAELREKLATRSIEPSQSDITLAQLLKRQDISYGGLLEMMGEQPTNDHETMEAIEITVKYEGYINRQLRQVAGFKKLESKQIPLSFDYDRVIGFSREVMEKLKKVRPASIGQASRISGVTPAAISLLLVALGRPRQSHQQYIP